MILVVWLGNIWIRYRETRHNAWRRFLDWLVGQDVVWTEKKNHYWLLVSWTVWWVGCLCVKPTTLMNGSGVCVKSLCSFYSIPHHHVLVVHDELELLPGQRKVKHGGWMAGHNGLRSIAAHIGTPDFTRIRIWIGRPMHPSQSVSDFVLSVPSQQEKDAISNQFPAIEEYVCQWVKDHG